MENIDIKTFVELAMEGGVEQTTTIEVPRYHARGIDFTVRNLIPHDLHEIRRESTNPKTGRVDQESYDVNLLISCMVNYNPADPEIQKALNVSSPAEVINRMFTPLEYAEFVKKVNAFALGAITETNKQLKN